MPAPALTPLEIETYLAFATDLAARAGEITVRYFRSGLSVDNKLADGRFDPVTAADREAETAIRDMIAARYPDHGLEGEEHGHEPGQSPFTWIIDPIDGTRSFISGVPLWGTLIALNDGRRPVLGVMDQPYIGEFFIGWPGGAQLRRRGAPAVDLATSGCTRLEDAILGCTDPAMFTTGERETFRALSARVRLRRYGGDCYFYCLLAAGAMDLVVESGLKPYDIQALIPIIEGAGGIVTSWSGGDPQRGGQVVAAATPELHARALDLLQAAVSA